MIDSQRLKRLQVELQISKRQALEGIDIDNRRFVTEVEKTVKVNSIEKNQSKELIHVFLKYGFEDEGLIQGDNQLSNEKQLKALYKQNLALKKAKLFQEGEEQLNFRNLNTTKLIKEVSQRSLEGREKMDSNFNSFKVVEGKESVNKKKFDSPTRIQNIILARNDSQIQYIQTDDNPYENSISLQRSQSVIQQRKQSQVSRFYNPDIERQKSKINQLLSQPIEIPSHLESSFLRDGLFESKKKRILQNQTIKNQSSVLTLPSIIKSDYESSRNQQQLHSVTQDYRANPSIQILEAPYIQNSNVVECSVSRPENIVRPPVIFHKSPSEAKRYQLPSRTRRLRSLANLIRKEPDIFQRQKMMFKLVDQAGEEVIGLSEMKKVKHDPHRESPLKNENPNSSIIAQIKSTFPLKADADKHHNPDDDIPIQQKDFERSQKLSSIVGEQSVLVFNDVLSVEKTFEIQNAKYNFKMAQLNDVIQQKIYQVQKDNLDENHIFQNKQKELQKMFKMVGKKVFNHKQHSEFEVLEWHKMRNLMDHRGIKLSKTGYELEDDSLIEESKSKKKYSFMKSKQNGIETGADFILNRFQAYSQLTSNRRKERHQQCLHESVTKKKFKEKSESPKRDQSKSPQRKDTVMSLQKSETSPQGHLDSHNSEGEQTLIQRKQTITSFDSPEDISPRQYKKKKQNQEDSLDEQTKLLVAKGNLKIQKEEQQNEQEKRYLDVEKFHGNVSGTLETMTKEIDEMQKTQEEDYDIFFTNNAIQTAKKKVMQRVLKDQQERDKRLNGSNPLHRGPDLIAYSSPIKINILPPAESVQQQPGVVFGLTQSPLQSSPREIQQQIQNPQQIVTPTKHQKMNLSATQTPNLKSHLQNLQEDQQKSLQKALEKAQIQQDFAKSLAKVYEKNENIDYDKQLRKIRRKTIMIEKQQLEALGEEMNTTEEENNQDNDSIDTEEQERRYEQEFMKDLFEKEEAMENEMLQKKLVEEKKENMQRKYLQLCKNEKVLPLPIINKIFEGVLSLDDYKLNFGLCKALGSVLDDLGDSLSKIDLRNNGISDGDFAEIIRGAILNPFIKSLAIRNNEFKEESLKELLKYFVDKKKPILEELIISSCKTKLSQINELLRVLSDYNNLTVLAICQSKLDKQSVLYLGDVANGNVNLRELDLSWNEVTSLNMWELVQNIEFCRQISYLNLSFNSFAGPRTNDIVESMCNFIKRNRNLIHLDLSYCGLKKDEVYQIIKSCKKSRSLLCKLFNNFNVCTAIHLTGNLVTDETKQKIREFMRPRKRVKDLYDMINEPDESDEKQEMKIGNIDVSAAIQQKLRQYKQEDADQNKDKSSGGAMKGQAGDRLIFSRILGHLEIPRSHMWQETQDCWICDKYRYTVLVLSKSIADKYFLKPTPRDRVQFLQKMIDAKNRRNEMLENKDDLEWGSDDDEIYYDADTEEQKNQNWLNNQICGTFSRWKSRSIIPLGEFMKRLKKNQEPSTKLIQVDKDIYESQIREYKSKLREKEAKKKSLRRMNALQQKQHGLHVDDDMEAEWKDKITNVDYDNVKSSWIYEMSSLLPYKDSVNLIIGLDKILEINRLGGGLLSDMKEKVYVFADYLPPGKHNTCLLYNTFNEPMKGMYSFVTPVRARLLPLLTNRKRVKEYRITRKFDKPNSMFKDFPEDTPAYLKKVFFKDIEQWKLGRVVKDQFEYRRLTDILLEYTERIKDIFNNQIAISSFPSISWIDFGNMCVAWKIPDNRTCTMLTVDRLFIATNVELVEQEDNPDRDLCRFEFYEIIVRLANAKYKDSGVVKTWDDAAKLILERNILPNVQCMGGQSFRNQYIWQLPIDDLFRANIEHVTKLLKKYSIDRKCFLDLDGCIDMMEDLQISETEIRQAYSFSKITIYDEMNQKDRYDNMLLPEFMDFICRCAYFKYKSQESLQFVEKVERVLDLLFKQIEVRRERPNFEIEVSSDSDYSSDD